MSSVSSTSSFLFVNHAFLVYMCGIPLNVKPTLATIRVRRPFPLRWAPFIRESPGLGQHAVLWDQVSRSSLEHCKTTCKNTATPGPGSRNEGNQVSRAKTAGQLSQRKMPKVFEPRKKGVDFEFVVGRIHQDEGERCHIRVQCLCVHQRSPRSPSTPLTPPSPPSAPSTSSLPSTSSTSPSPPLPGASLGWKRFSRSCPAP